MDSILSTVNINLFLPHSILPAESKSIIKLMPFIQEGFPQAWRGVKHRYWR